MQNTYLGKTRLDNYSKGQDPKNPPCNEALTLFMSSATATYACSTELT
jgi:hypothetical protein